MEVESTQNKNTSEFYAQNAQKKPSRSSKACLECRSMKSRCNGDGVHSCERCTKRGVNCVYEQTVRRRGKDKRPRVVTKRLKSESCDFEPMTNKRLRHTHSHSSDSVDGNTADNADVSHNADNSFQHLTHSPQPISGSIGAPPQPPPPPRYNHSAAPEVINGTSFIPSQTQISPHSAHSPLSPHSPILITPNMNYQRESFWDILITDRCTTHNLKDRAKATKLISSDLWFTFSRCDFITTLFNMHKFFDNLSCSSKRYNAEPSLIQALLAISHTLQGQFQLAYLMADRAHSSLRTAMMTGRFTVGIAQSAIVLQYYESFPLGTFNIKRVAAPLYAADAVIKNLALTCLDADKVSHVFDDDAIPISTSDPQFSGQDLNLAPSKSHHHPSCPCESWSIPAHMTRKEESVRFRHIPKFSIDDTQVPDSDIQQEEIRRVVWGTANNGWYLQMLDPHAVSTLHTSQASNYGVFYTAESFILSIPDDGMKSWSRYTLWAFLDRLKLLCHAATRLSRSLPPFELHMRASKICSEVEKIESDLNALHSCHRGVHGWHVSNVAFITRLILTAKTRQFTNANVTNLQKNASVPSAYYTRQRAREWLDAHSLIWDNVINKHSIKRQPMIFVALVCQALRCLDLLALDSAFTRAIYVARSLLKGIDEMISIYPIKESADINRILLKVHMNCDELETRTNVAPYHTADNHAAELLLENLKKIKSEP